MTSSLRRTSAVIPAYNCRELLRRALASLRRASTEVEVIVVDGSSSDGSGQMVRDEFPEVRLLQVTNYGYTHNINRGVEIASGERLLLMDSDLFITKEALLAMSRRLDERPALGAVAPRLLNDDGSLHWYVFGPHYPPNWFERRSPIRVDFLTGACVLTRRRVLDEVGLYDEGFFHFNVELDWFRRARTAGYAFEVLPEKVIHVGGGSIRPSPAWVLETRRSFLYFISKHWHPVSVDAIRRAMQLEALCRARVDPDDERRAMWRELGEITRTGDYLRSPFPLSGRGARGGGRAA